MHRHRNVGIMAHIDAGKTTLTERILKITGRIHRMGEVHDGAATMDYLEEERERGITITSAAVNVEWKDTTITVIDTPGHVDFTAEVERSMRVLDGAICIFDASEGVEPQSETVWRQAERYGVPRLCFINKMDKPGANFQEAVQSVKDKLGAFALPIQLPIGRENQFTGIIDLVHMKAWHYDSLEERREIPIPDAMMDEVKAGRTALLEAVAERDEQLLDLYLSGEDIPVKEIVRVLRAATISNEFQPVFCGSALKDKGIQRLCDGIIAFLPSPFDLPPTRMTDADGNALTRTVDPDGKLAALAFKTIHDRTGDLTFLRIYSGTLRRGDAVWNTRKHTQERVGRLLVMKANEREPVDEMGAGKIVAAIGLKEATTGDTLCTRDEPVLLESMEFPEAVISVSLEPKEAKDRDKLGEIVGRLMREDPTFRAVTNEATDELIISGMGELHLEVTVNRIQNEFKCGVATGRPKVAYKQQFSKTVETEARYIRQSGGRGQYAVAHVRIESAEVEDGVFEFVDKIKGGNIPREYIPKVGDGLESMARGGARGGFPFVNVRATLFDGKSHDVDSSELAFFNAGVLAFRQAVEGNTTLLEPIMKLDVRVPEEFLGAVVGDLNSRRGEVGEVEAVDDLRIIRGLVPVAEMFAYSSALRGATQGRGSFSMELHEYRAVPGNIAKKVLESDD